MSRKDRTYRLPTHDKDPLFRLLEKRRRELAEELGVGEPESTPSRWLEYLRQVRDKGRERLAWARKWAEEDLFDDKKLARAIERAQQGEREMACDFATAYDVLGLDFPPALRRCVCELLETGLGQGSSAPSATRIGDAGEKKARPGRPKSIATYYRHFLLSEHVRALRDDGASYEEAVGYVAEYHGDSERTVQRAFARFKDSDTNSLFPLHSRH